ncbi:hypothetical protein CEP48_00200 [Mergibacter septicus]|uniref:Uncharacterized protein n=1 Tax=Mergibacter septicus TaxID=221402 RepID=A0A8D4IZ15_9PAST|nr:hypothetical protein [Mergibacter septicus]AWX14704.1 hypothetical protein CEP47_00200 [Mergibacter septicus]QDJ13955.1 hypothetical protein CEP48_00200 [Mergibacter septicus]UTU48596.1 hypothetical protein HLL31_07435 [Mergibacter septicus]WMR95776.1 hypothetical protein RDJ12_07575 [Mergibacter septicus]
MTTKTWLDELGNNWFNTFTDDELVIAYNNYVISNSDPNNLNSDLSLIYKGYGEVSYIFGIEIADTCFKNSNVRFSDFVMKNGNTIEKVDVREFIQHSIGVDELKNYINHSPLLVELEELVSLPF